MAAKERGISKLMVAVPLGNERCYLFSRKRAKGQAKHRQLELLGGHMDDEVDPLAALLKELDEEEKSGVLSAKVQAEQRPFERLVVDGKTHFMFEIEITLEEYLDLRHGKKESLGFKLIPATALNDRELQWRFTSKTREILARWSTRGSGVRHE